MNARCFAEPLYNNEWTAPEKCRIHGRTYSAVLLSQGTLLNWQNSHGPSEGLQHCCDEQNNWNADLDLLTLRFFTRHRSQADPERFLGFRTGREDMRTDPV